METTRHFTATVYVVNDGVAALHYHPKLEIHIPPGGHVDRDELPHEAGLRETREETGLEPTLLDDTDPVGAPAGRTLPTPREQLLYDIDTDGDDVFHQHVDHIYFATVPSREIDPAPGEASPDAWAWYDRKDLEESHIDADTRALARRAIETAENA
ncbi:NUDIX domain-containing protein [Halolamina sp. CBA1230]|uniref:NUDIX hydrolase n=1 Tax=Halolamina sp. CBA1230 TaxID=1853690 RepID=UPI0009A17241|nr:NUDIX domain-containing protein [Halolamina sp. CBA1230]QKY19062.1 NUDIX domain-containing protein [Halolamina sp. CBA1230]